ncbi:hypothetical protein [Phytoactinopolyspora endophytica]|uniref:hypothetical protein n=1 Tax=Phytoactinopolyspora endophytica TaxID=1642495 RepID=UPI00101DD5F3|nr:hypothetical protein [Phytoactinopolyspora endophytica]
MTNPTTTRAAVITGVAIAVGGAVLTSLTWWYALRTANGQLIDMMAYEELARVLPGNPWPAVESALDTAHIVALVGTFVVAALLIGYRRAWHAAVQILVLIAGATTTALIMNALAPPLFEAQSMPAYPFAAAVDTPTVLFLCAGVAVVTAVSPSTRALTAVLVGLPIAFLTASQLSSYAQRPSTFITASLVVTTWIGLVTATAPLLRRTGLKPPAATSRSAGAAATASATIALMLIAAASAAISAALINQWLDGELRTGGYRGEMTLTFIAGALAIGASVCVATAMALVGNYATDSPDASTDPYQQRPSHDGPGFSAGQPSVTQPAQAVDVSPAQAHPGGIARGASDVGA